MEIVHPTNHNTVILLKKQTLKRYHLNKNQVIYLTI